MNVIEYCQSNKLDISQLSEVSLEALGGMYLEGVNPTQARINRLASMDKGKLSPSDAIKETIKFYQSNQNNRQQYAL
jgi:hypothetical protein